MSMHIGRSTKVALAQRMQSIEWLAHQLGVSRQRANTIANSRHAQSRTIDRLSKLFGIKASEFIALGEFENERNGDSAQGE